MLIETPKILCFFVQSLQKYKEAVGDLEKACLIDPLSSEVSKLVATRTSGEGDICPDMLDPSYTGEEAARERQEAP